MYVAIRRKRVGAHKQLKYNPHVNEGEHEYVRGFELFT